MQQVEIMEWHNGLLRELLLAVPPEAPWEETTAQVVARFEESKSVWRGAQITLQFGIRSVPPAALESLVETLEQEYSLLVVAVVATDWGTQEAAKRLNLNVYSMLPGSSTEASQAGGAGNNVLYIANTVRSGQRIVHTGTIVIGADVNAGAEVVAAGDILIFGTLRGLAHAGSHGDENARIVAGNMRPQQLRIAGQIARSPESEPIPAGARQPEVARIENGAIQVSLV